mgnify:CR=1 FL=1
MKIEVESLGLPSLSKLIGKKTVLEMDEGTAADLIAHIADRAGSKARKILLDSKGELDMTIQIMLKTGFGEVQKLAIQKTVKLRVLAVCLAIDCRN